MSLREYKPFFIVCALVLLLILVVSVLSAFWPQYEERFFELGLLGKDKKAEGYYLNDNSTLEIGSAVLWHIYVHNHMGSAEKVSVRVKLLNSTMEPPDDREHEPSPFPHFTEILISLSVDETCLIPFSWKVVEADSQNGSTMIQRIMANDEIFEVNISGNRFRMVFELWAYDESDHKYKFLWGAEEESHSASLYMWFNMHP